MANDERDFDLKFLTAPLDALKQTGPSRRAHFHLHRRQTGDIKQQSPRRVPGEDNSSDEADDLVGFSEKANEPVRSGQGHAERKEARPIELFYDLFMVANLTIFSGAYEISDLYNVASYIGFFSKSFTAQILALAAEVLRLGLLTTLGLLWFTWLNLAFFTIRFGQDCVMERLFMGLQLGGMVAFAVLAPQFSPDSHEPVWSIFMSTSLILMGTRILLALQYLSVAWLARKRAEVRDPLLIIAGSSLIAGIIYGGLTATFVQHRHYHAYMAWFIVGGVEIIVNIFVTSEWKLVSFRGTHLVERMRLLTLIILGEGIIQLFETLEALTSNIRAYSPATAGNIFSIVLIYYFLYMLYFEKTKKKYFGLIREQVWAFLHWGLHISLILVVSGVNKFFIVNKASDVAGSYYNDISNLQIRTGNLSTTQDIQNYGHALQAYTARFTSEYESEASITQNQTAILNQALQNTIAFNSSFYPGQTPYQVVGNFTLVVQSYIGVVLLQAYSFENNDANEDFQALGFDITSKIETVYVYVFLCAGLSLLFIALMFYIRHSYHVRVSLRSWLSIVTHVVFGLTLCLLTITETGITQINASSDFVFSDWSLPLIAIFYFVCVCVDIAVSYRWQNLWQRNKESKFSSD